MKARTCLRLLSGAMAVFLSSSFAFSQNPTFEKRSYGAIGSLTHADFNNDGREDFIAGTTSLTGTGFRATMSTGDGIYGSPVNVPGPKAFTQFAIGDFNQDGNADVIAAGGDNHFYTYYGRGDGTFSAPIDNVTLRNVGPLVAGDFNHDGRVDLAFLTDDDVLHVYFANPGGGWTVGPTTPNIYGTQILQVGDFDGDGKADIMSEEHDMGTSLQILFGDNAGHFTVLQPSQNRAMYYEVRDVNGDGISDLLAVDWVYTTNGDTNMKTMQAIYGNRSRTFSSQTITFSKCLSAAGSPAVADVNGDGLPDLVFVEEDNCIGAAPDYLVVATRKPDGTYNPEQVLATSSSTNIGSWTALRANRDTKPDFSVTLYASAGNYTTDVYLNNTAGGVFPGCAAPNGFRGINVCTPAAGSTAASPVRFSIGTSTMTPGRKVEVWVDGVKKAEQLKKQFSTYAFLDSDIPLTAGSHNVTVYAAGFDNLLQKKSFMFNVGSGGGTCSAPSTATGTVICSPANGTTVSSPVSVQARGGSSVNFMEVWVDGTKRYQTSGNSVSTSLTFSAGSHHMSVYSKNGSTVVSKATSDFTVK